MEIINTNNVVAKKKTMGRRKIALDRKIEKKSNLQVTFTKRRQGLFRKASELVTLCGAEIAILVRSPAGKIYTFRNPSADAVIRRFEGGAEPSSRQIVKQLEGKSTEYDEAVRNFEKRDPIWWDKP